MMRGFAEVIREPRFYTYAFAGAFSFAGLFVYVTGSPIIFLDGFHVDPRTYGLIFAGLAAGCIGATQLNIWLTRHFSGDAIFRVAVIGQTVVMAIIFIGRRAGLVRACCQHRSAAAVSDVLRRRPFPMPRLWRCRPSPRISAAPRRCLGFIQMGIGALASTGVGLLHASTSLPIYAMMAATAVIGLVILLANQKRAILQSKRIGV